MPYTCPPQDCQGLKKLIDDWAAALGDLTMKLAILECICATLHALIGFNCPDRSGIHTEAEADSYFASIRGQMNEACPAGG